MSAPNPLAVARARQQRLAEEAAPRWYVSDRRYTGHMVALVAAATDGTEPADQTYTQPQTGAVLTVSPIVEFAVAWTCEKTGQPANLEYYALREKPKRVLVVCAGCGDRWDEKR